MQDQFDLVFRREHILTLPPLTEVLNPKSQIRSPKQIPSTKREMTKTSARRPVSSIGPLGIWICFEFRASGFRVSALCTV